MVAAGRNPHHRDAAVASLLRDRAGAAGLRRFAVPDRDQHVDLPQQEVAAQDIALVAHLRRRQLGHDAGARQAPEEFVAHVAAVAGRRGLEVLEILVLRERQDRLDGPVGGAGRGRELVGALRKARDQADAVGFRARRGRARVKVPVALVGLGHRRLDRRKRVTQLPLDARQVGVRQLVRAMAGDADTERQLRLRRMVGHGGRVHWFGSAPCLAQRRRLPEVPIASDFSSSQMRSLPWPVRTVARVAFMIAASSGARYLIGPPRSFACSSSLALASV